MTIKIGDRVSWTKQSQRGGVIEMKLKEGDVEAIVRGMAIVKCGRTRYHVPLAKLRTPDEKSEITEVIEALRKSTLR